MRTTTKHTASTWTARSAVTTVGLLASALTVSVATLSVLPSGAAAPSDCTQPGPYQLPHGNDKVDLDPAQFTTTIDNPYWPMTPGTTWRYVERGGGSVARVTVRVTDRTKVVNGITTRVVRDIVREDGEKVEDTRDWYAQDLGGSIWYLGEYSVSYEDGKPVSTEGSWEYGVDGAQAGVIVPADPVAGCSYREEYRKGVALDRALVLSTKESITGPTGTHSKVLHTANTTPLDKTLLENKFYARGVGPVLELDLSPELGTAELVEVTR